MAAWWRDQCRETIEEWHRRLHQADAALWAGLDALVDQMPGVGFTQAFQRKGRACAIPQQPFKTAALVSLDAYVSIDREAAAVFPLGRHLRVVRRQQPALQGRAQQSSPHGSLNLADCRRIQSVGRVKGDATSRITFEHIIHHHAMEVQMGAPQRAKAVDEDDGAEPGRCTGAGTVLAQHPLDGGEENVQWLPAGAPAQGAV